MIKSKNIVVDKMFKDSSTGVLRVYPTVSSKTATVTAKTANATLTSSNFESIITNTGDTDNIVLTLPAAATVVDKAIKIATTAATTITVTPASGEKIYLNGSGVASKYLLIAGVIGNFAEIYCDGTDYVVTNYSGVVTKEA
jgi:hypothetical protein